MLVIIVKKMLSLPAVMYLYGRRNITTYYHQPVDQCCSPTAIPGANLFFLTMLRQHSQYDSRLGFSFRDLVRVMVRVRLGLGLGLGLGLELELVLRLWLWLGLVLGLGFWVRVRVMVDFRVRVRVGVVVRIRVNLTLA